jgi:hypothetical protein
LLLADQGAEVIRVDPSGGPAGGIRPMPYCSAASAASCWTSKAPMIVRSHATWSLRADVVIENFQRGTPRNQRRPAEGM